MWPPPARLCGSPLPLRAHGCRFSQLLYFYILSVAVLDFTTRGPAGFANAQAQGYVPWASSWAVPMVTSASVDQAFLNLTAIDAGLFMDPTGRQPASVPIQLTQTSMWKPVPHPFNHSWWMSFVTGVIPSAVSNAAPPTAFATYFIMWDAAAVVVNSSSASAAPLPLLQVAKIHHGANPLVLPLSELEMTQPLMYVVDDLSGVESAPFLPSKSVVLVAGGLASVRRVQRDG